MSLDVIRIEWPRDALKPIALHRMKSYIGTTRRTVVSYRAKCSNEKWWFQCEKCPHAILFEPRDV